MKKNLLPILLIAGAAVAFMAFRRRRSTVTVSAESPEIQTGAQYEAEYAETVKPSVIDIGTKIVDSLFAPKEYKKKAATQAKKVAVQRAVKSGKITKKQAKAVTQSLSKGIMIRGFNDNSVLV